MGYGFYTRDGRPLGYMVLATCDKRGCDAEIDRGLGYMCGGDDREPGLFTDGPGCGRYYCPGHLGWVGERGGCHHPRGFRYWGRTLSCMEPNADGTVVCLFRAEHREPHAWGDR